MRDEKFCCVGDFPVLVPYKDLEQMVAMANNQAAFEQRLSQMDERLTAIYGIYTEVLDKLREINKLL